MEPIRLVLALVIAIGCTIAWPRFTKLNPFFSLLAASLLFGMVAGVPWDSLISSIQTGFGGLLQQIGILVAFGSVLGSILEKTHAINTISHGMVKLVGPGKPVLAMSAIGVLVGIPVFCDSGFIILSRLIPSIASQTGASGGSMTLALASGLITTHVLVPPTPGPLAAATNLGMGSQLGLVMMLGLVVSIPVALVAYVFAKHRGSLVTPVFPSELNSSHIKNPHTLLCWLPLLTPVLLIAAGSMAPMVHLSPGLKWLAILGNPMIALGIGVILSLLLVEPSKNPDWTTWVTEALKDAGVIILITGAGGSFGMMIRNSDLATLLTQQANATPVHGLVFLMMAWLLAALLKTAQGSSTTSMIMVSAVLAPLASSAGITSGAHMALLVTAIAGGSLVVSHANDSYFWVVSQFGRISTKQTLGYYTPMTLIQGVVALIMTLLLFMLV
ncbi:MAG TPA: GntP family permease [Cyclobacteriaceae bacterium]|nr:GntP family permease [Cyclobacteriaceae bacterium]